ncbi:MAG: hypothetical protein ABI794_15775 [Betaproteobacteria bacterium]
MAAATKRGIKRRIKSGWWLGLTQWDAFIWIGTLLIVAQVILIPYAGWKRVTSSAAYEDLTHEMSNAMGTKGAGTSSSGHRVRAASPPPAVGGQGWTFGFMTDINPGPRYSTQNRMLPAHTPVHVLGQSADGQYLQVEATLLSGKKLTGYVLAERVQSADPTAGARPESGWVMIKRPGGAQLRAAPDFDAEMYGMEAEGNVVKVLARLKKNEWSPGVTGDFLLVEAGPRGKAWIAALQVKPAQAPAQ